MPLIKCPNPNCGCMISTKATVCPKCGHVISGSTQNNNGSSQSYDPPQQPVQHGYPPQQQSFPQNYPPQPPYPPQPQPEDKASVGLCILSFLIPLAGWILYFVKRDDTPVKAKACSTWAWIGFGINFISIISAI